MRLAQDAGSAPRRVGFLDRIFFVDYAEMQRIEGFRNPLYACQVAIMMMFSRVGFPILALLCVLWMRLERGLPEHYWLENLSANQRLMGGGAFVIVVYAWLYRRFSSYAFTPFSANEYDTKQNRLIAKWSLILAIACPLIAWLTLKTWVHR